VAEKTESFSDEGEPEASVKGTTTLAFTDASAGTITAAVTQWIGAWDAESKEFINTMVSADNGPFTYTYDSAVQTGTVTYTRKSMFGGGDDTTTLQFTVDVSAKTLTTTEVDDGETETSVYKLQ
jgi:hypothetical protein